MYVQGGLPFSHICYAFKIETLSRSYTHSSVEHKHAYIYVYFRTFNKSQVLRNWNYTISYLKDIITVIIINFIHNLTRCRTCSTVYFDVTCRSSDTFCINFSYMRLKAYHWWYNKRKVSLMPMIKESRRTYSLWECQAGWNWDYCKRSIVYL